MIGLVNYRMGNIQSVINGLEAVGAKVKVVRHPEDLSEVEAIVLPGVGAFGDGMSNLKSLGFIEALEQQVVKNGKHLLGICLGLQLLAERSFEYGEHKGLGWIPGEVIRLTTNEDRSIRIPHVGWNNIEVVNKTGLYKDIEEEPTLYFVHSYAIVPGNESMISGYCMHGEKFVASIEYNNISATQFHPEKSQKDGLKLLANWCKMVNAC